MPKIKRGRLCLYESLLLMEEDTLLILGGVLHGGDTGWTNSVICFPQASKQQQQQPNDDQPKDKHKQQQQPSSPSSSSREWMDCPCMNEKKRCFGGSGV